MKGCWSRGRLRRWCRHPNEVPGVTHSIWFRGRQIGETKFEYKHTATQFAGAFYPTAFGLTMLPDITAMGPALFSFGEMCRRAGVDTDDASSENASAALKAF